MSLGDRHCLHRFEISHPQRDGSPATWAMLLVTRIGVGGLIASMDSFGPDDLTHALDRLLRSWAEHEGGDWTPIGRHPLGGHIDLINEGRWDELATYFTEDFTATSHRRAGQGVTTNDGLDRPDH
jgi:hypothetical protein